MENLPNIDPVLETEKNPEPSVSENDRRMSEMLGLNIRTSISDNNDTVDDDAEDNVSESSEGNNDESQGEEPQNTEPSDDQPNEGEEEGNADDFWGAPDEAGNYKISKERLDYLKNTLAMVAHNVAQREQASRNAEAAYRAKLEEIQRIRQSQNQPQETAQPKKTALDLAKEKMTADLVAAGMAPEEAKKYVDGQTELFRAAVMEQSNEQLKQFDPMFRRMQENVYREDVVDITKKWGDQIASNLREFNVTPEECHRNVQEYVKGYISSFYQTNKRMPTQNELYRQLAIDSGKLGSMTLSERLNGLIAARRKAAAAASQQPKPQPQPTPESREPIQPDTTPSTVAAQKRVTTGENLRMANDANVMGTTPSSGASAGNADRERMARLLSEANGGNFYFNS